MEQLLDREELKLMAEVGLLAATRGDAPAAEAIFAAVAQERPDAAVVYFGSALAQLFVGQSLEAIDILQRGLTRVPVVDQPALHALLALAFQSGGRAAEYAEALEAAGNSTLAEVMRSRRFSVHMGG